MSRATSSARRVLPLPPAPASVTSRGVGRWSSSISVVRSRSRPTRSAATSGVSVASRSLIDDKLAKCGPPVIEAPLGSLGVIVDTGSHDLSQGLDASPQLGKVPGVGFGHLVVSRLTRCVELDSKLVDLLAQPLFAVFGRCLPAFAVEHSGDQCRALTGDRADELQVARRECLAVAKEHDRATLALVDGEWCDQGGSL